MKQNPGIRLSSFILIQVLFNTILGIFFSRKKFWPSIDVLAPLEAYKRSDEIYFKDLFVSSSLEISGRTPFISIMRTVDFVFPGNSQLALSVISSLTIAFASSLLFLAIISSKNANNFQRTTIIPKFYLIAYLVYITGVHWATKLPYGDSLYLAGFGPFSGPWATPEYLAVVLNCTAFIYLNTSTSANRLAGKVTVFILLLSATIIHPASTFFLSLLILTAKYFFKTLSKNVLILYLSSLFISVAFLILVFLQESSSLSSEDFVEIYSVFRHPHHYLPSEYLSKFNVGFYFIAFIFGFFLCRKSPNSKRIVSFFFLLVLAANFLQYIVVELYPTQILSALGPSRINNYILIALWSILATNIEDWSDYWNPPGKSSYQNLMTIPRVLTSWVVLFVLLFSSSTYVNSDLKGFRSQIEAELEQLQIEKGDLVIVDSSISTEGWREFGYVNVWFDFYFMFNISGIKTYRERWLASCGEVGIGDCKNSLFEGDSKALIELMMKNGIGKIVSGVELDEKFLRGNFKLLGTYEMNWSYGLIDFQM